MALMCVIALHIALYLGLRGSTGWQVPVPAPARPVAARVELTLRLLPWREPAARRAMPATPRSAKPAADQLAQSRAPQAITVAAPSTPRPAAAAPAPTQAYAAPTPEPAASQAPRPLDLTLPSGFATRPGARNPAVDDPRANSAQPTPEQRMASVLDTRVIEEELGDGRRRIRRGASCVILKPSRLGQLLPFDEAAARTPSLVGACP